MRNQKVLFILICFLLINTSTQFSVFAGEQWQKITTNNFTLIGNGNDKKIKKVGIKLEQFREAIQRIDANLSADSHIPTTVIVFKDNESFHRFKPVNSNGEITDWVAGYFQAGIDVNYIALSFESKNADAFQTIFHEYTHNLIDTNYGRKNVPTWFGEGLAEYYDQFKVQNDQTVKFGGRNESHLTVLRDNDFIPLEKFFNTDYETLRLQSQAGANVYYAQAWALMHYFIRGEKGKRKPQLDKFIGLLIGKKDLKESFKESFNMSFDDLESKVSTYFKIRKFYFTKKRFVEKLTANIKTSNTKLTNAEVEAYFGDLFYQRKLFTQAEIHIQKALKTNPNLSLANSTLGLIRMKQGRFNEASLYIERSINSNIENYLIYYRYAFFLSRDAASFNSLITTYSDERTLQMRNALSKAIALHPSFPDSYQLLGFINLVRNENFDQGIKQIKKALSLTPKNHYYKINLAQIYLRKKDFVNAENILNSLVKNANDEEIITRANNILNSINRIKNETVSQNVGDNFVKELESYSSAINTKNSPRALTEAELEKNRQRTENEAISEVLLKPKRGQKRIVGQISKVVCKNNKVIFEMFLDNQTTKYQSKNLQKLLMKTYTAEMSGVEFDCGFRNDEVLAVLIYQPTKGVTTEILGEVISIEFVSRDFELVNSLTH